MEIYITRRHGGLYDSENNFIMHDDVGGAEKYSQLVIEAKDRQLSKQKELTRKDIFQLIGNGFKDFTVKELTPIVEAKDIVSKEFLAIADRLGILMQSNGYGGFLMTSKDDRSPLTRDELIDLFNGVINSLNLGSYFDTMTITASEIMTRVIVLMHTL